ncbi:hypothetical protein EGW08_019528 [Elysia chlorotica]|uniref:Uncharacterized protein n=1 Tax=Elysia chlorotica TaxID=188477 RepID=A0A433STU6_ELYCH|nr:hypothetical protein EGW08_019528 [Elysia chlorotica]
MSEYHTPNRTSKFRPQVANPWENDSRAVTAIRNCLILAEQMGLRTMPKENEQRCAEQLASLPSTKIIEVQKELSSKTESLFQLQKNIAAHVHDKEAGDFLQIKNIEQRINMITQLCTDLDKVLQNTEALIHRLRKPFVGNFIKMDARYHSEACQVLKQLVPTLNDLASNINNITWAANHDFSAATLEALMVQIQSQIASTQTSLHNVNTLKHGILEVSTSSNRRGVTDNSADESL